MSALHIVEVLDYGMSLLDDGNILKKDGTIISAEKFAELQNLQDRNKLDWIEVNSDEFFALLENAKFATKTYEENTTISGISSSKYGFAILSSEDEPIYLRSSEFSGSEKFEFAIADYGRLIYNVDKNSTEIAFDTLTKTLEEAFGVNEQVGSEFSPDSENTFLIKKFIKDGFVWSVIYKNNKLSNIKKGESITCEAEVNSKTSKVTARLDKINLV